MPQERSFWQLVCDAAARAPQRVVLADDYGRTLTTTRLRDAAEQVAAGLPVRPGMVVSWQLPTTVEACVLMCALARLGAVQNPVIPVLRERDVALIAKAAGTELLHHREQLARLRPRGDGPGPGPGRGRHRAGGRPGRAAAAAGRRSGRAAPAPRSGPGVPLAVLLVRDDRRAQGTRHSDSTIIAASNAVTDLQGMHDGDVYPIVFPVSHIGGIAMLAAVLRAGGPAGDGRHLGSCRHPRASRGAPAHDPRLRPAVLPGLPRRPAAPP